MFLAYLMQYIEHLTSLMESDDKINEGQSFSLRFGCIISLTHLAQIAFLLAQVLHLQQPLQAIFGLSSWSNLNR